MTFRATTRTFRLGVRDPFRIARSHAEEGQRATTVIVELREIRPRRAFEFARAREQGLDGSDRVEVVVAPLGDVAVVPGAGVALPVAPFVVKLSTAPRPVPLSLLADTR